MDRIYRHQRHIYDATRKYYLLGRDQLIGDLDMKPGQSLLEVGCGTGRNLVLASRLYPGIKLAGLDISEEMLSTARKALTREGNFHAALKRADAARYSASEFSVEGFDRIMISYALSMIPEWQKTIEQSIAALNPGGSLHIADFGQQTQLPVGFRTLLQSWLTRFHVTPRANLKQVLEDTVRDGPYRLEFRSYARDYAWIATIRRLQH
ncbi:methyltransferase domain-containing protein [Rhizobium sp. KVB221]|uniref:Methyltransferase domain-containing protein n=2 Tax=Rhizobium setariae TaxID=2801340 RepID=A0A936YU09_9HYPH|nr:methyltransferase domain-containing protein [Rhizobium setariae]